MRKPIRAGPEVRDEFDELLVSRGVGVAFQPIVELSTGDVVGYEALARPPAGSSFADPAALFAEAYRRGRVGELDWICRAAAFAAALDKNVPPDLPLFLNAEPSAMDAPCPPDLRDLATAATERCQFVIEVTERSLTDDPATLLAAIGRIREVSMALALDDVGADPASLALMPLIAPDIIKLDLRLVQAQPTEEVAWIVSAVLAESERTGALILAEGVETERHVAVARAMGATLGQGWFFGVPAPLPDDLVASRRPLRLAPIPPPPADTPFITAVAHRSPVTSTTELLVATSRHLEHEVLRSAGKAVLLSSFQNATRFTPATRRRYERLARRTVLTTAFGRDMPAEPGRRIRGANLHPDDPLCDEWAVVVVGNQLSAALVARAASESAPGEPAQWEVIITHDRDLVLAAAKSLLQRLPAVRG